MRVQPGGPLHVLGIAETDDGFGNSPDLIPQRIEQRSDRGNGRIDFGNGRPCESSDQIGCIHELGKGEFVAIEAFQKLQIRLGDFGDIRSVSLCDTTCRRKLLVDDTSFCFYGIDPFSHWTNLSMPLKCFGFRPLNLAVLTPILRFGIPSGAVASRYLLLDLAHAQVPPGAARGVTARLSSSTPSNGCTGTTTGACSDPSAMSLRSAFEAHYSHQLRESAMTA